MVSLMASVGKVVAFAAMIRVFTGALASRADDWRPVFWVLSVVTLVVGSALAVVQKDVKRMLAYSSISHAGFILVGVVAASSNEKGVNAALAYLAVYAVLVVGTFAAVSTVAGAGDTSTTLDDWRGLAKAHPVLGIGITTLLLAQAGVPLTSGFVAKFGVIQSAVGSESYVLAVLAMVAAVIAAYLYLRIMVSVWLQEGERSFERPQMATSLVIAASVVITLVIGFFPDLLLNFVDSI